MRVIETITYKEFDPVKYVEDKMEFYPDYIFRKEFTDINEKGISIIIQKKTRMDFATCASLVGIDSMQDVTEEAVKDLIDTRFNNAIKCLEEHQGA